jgi:hypothetical protein
VKVQLSIGDMRSHSPVALKPFGICFTFEQIGNPEKSAIDAAEAQDDEIIARTAVERRQFIFIEAGLDI